MTVTVPGYSTLTGRPEVIINLLKETDIFEKNDINIEAFLEVGGQAEFLLFAMAATGLIEISD